MRSTRVSWALPPVRAALRHPRRTLAAAGLVAVAAAAGLPRLELRLDGRALASADSPARLADREIRQRFDLREPVALVVDSDDPRGAFNPATLERVRRLSEALAGLEGVRPQDLLSLATEQGLRHRRGELGFRTFLDPLPEKPAELATLVRDLERIGLYEGVLVSRDRKATAILLGLPPEADRTTFLRRVEEELRRSATPGEPRERIALVGAAVAESTLGRHLLADLGLPRSLLGGEPGRRPLGLGLLPLSLLAMGALLLAVFRRPAAALLPLTGVGLATLVVYGAMGWLGVGVELPTAVLPVILLAIGVADSIHVFRRFGDLHRRRPGLGAKGLVLRTMAETAPPVVRTSLTTAAALLAFAASPIGAVRAFGLWAAAGVLLLMLFSLTVLPVLLARGGPRLFLREAGGPAHGRAFWPGLAGLAWRRPRTLLAGAAVLLLPAAVGIFRLQVEDSWTGAFDPASPFARAARAFDQRFLGSHRLLVEMRSEALRLGGELPEARLAPFRLTIDPVPGLAAEELAGSWLEVAAAEGGEREGRTPRRGTRPRPPRRWSTWVETARVGAEGWDLELPRQRGSPRFWIRPEPGEDLRWELHRQPLMIPTVLERVATLEAFLAGRPEVGGVLGPAAYLATASFMLRPEDPASRRLPADPVEARQLWSGIARFRGPERLAQLVAADHERALVTAFLPHSTYRRTAGLLAALGRFETEELRPRGLVLTIGGDAAVSRDLVGAVVTSQVRSLLLALAAVFAVASLTTRSLREGLSCLLPPAVAVASVFAAMGWWGIALGVATSIFAGMVFGLGVDFAIHLLHRLRLARAAGLSGRAALAEALATGGPAIAIDAAALGLGFAVLAGSTVPANARLGLLLAISVAAALAASLLLLPSLLALGALGSGRRARDG